MILRRYSKGRADVTDKNLNHSFRAYLHRVGNPDRDRVVLIREDKDQKGGNSDNKGLEVVGHHIRCSRLAYGLGHRDWDQGHCMRGSLTFAFGDPSHLLCHGNRLFLADHPCHQRIC